MKTSLAEVFKDESLLDSLGISTVYGVGVCGSRRVRYLSKRRVVQTGDNNFDRWANSVEHEFDLTKDAERLKFAEWARKEREAYAASKKGFVNSVKRALDHVDVDFSHDYDSFSFKPMNWRDFAFVLLVIEYSPSKWFQLSAALLGLHITLVVFKEAY